MAISNRDRVGRTLDLLKGGLAPFVAREFENLYKGKAQQEAEEFLVGSRLKVDRPIAEWDVAPLLRLMGDSWNVVFRKTLGRAERTLVFELQDVRNGWAHQETFSSDDTYRALDSAGRLLTAISAPEAEFVEKMKNELLRVRFDEQVRHEKRKSAVSTFESKAAQQLKPWREVVTPHKDVASGEYQQAEFAADLWQVHMGEGTDEYRNPLEFFRRTFLTESLQRLLVGAVRRVTSGAGDPVVQLQTNFGGGKTHSMLALYHLLSGTSPGDLPGLDEVMKQAGVDKLPAVKRAVLVGNKISPGNPIRKSDGTEVRTLWGELAWQLGGKEAYDRLRADDEKATSPGDALRELFNDYGPCLVLIDEWVAYARQLHQESDLPGGSFETQFSFAQVLTESAKLARNCLLVISLPASDTATTSSDSPYTRADDAEVGGQRGREALDRLRNVIGRVESSWRPASAEEGFEIVRRRLFEPMSDTSQYKDRDVVARAFADLYRSAKAEFPAECSESEYERRIKVAYPIHPEVFDRLYTDWSTLVKFQRTRGVLRLMASVIHSLWEKGDKNPLILPANIPIDDARVEFELTRYLSDQWAPIIAKDIDGPNSLPLRIDGEVSNLGKFSACRRVARTIYLGSAPGTATANKGVEDRRVKLGCVTPGETPAVFGDALRRLAEKATYLYQDGARYWYATQPTVTKLAQDRADQFRRESDRIVAEIEARVRADLRKAGEFARVHPLPQSGQDVPDDTDTRLVVLGPEYPYSKDPENAATAMAKRILESRGNAPRLFRNSLVFLAPDQTRLQELDDAVRRYLAWESIVAEREELDLSPHQVKQAETQRSSADATVVARLPETYQWLLVPVQMKPKDEVDWQAFRLTGAGSLAERASKKLVNEELLVPVLAGTRLRMELDNVPLWRDDHVEIKQLVEDFARYLYLPRLVRSSVLLDAIKNGLGLLMWRAESFAYADSWDEAGERYVGLRAGKDFPIPDGDPGLLVKAEVAAKQMESDHAAIGGDGAGGGSNDANGTGGGSGAGGTGEGATGGTAGDPNALVTGPRRFFGTVDLDPSRAGRDASKIAEEVIAHLEGIVGAEVRVTLEIEADIPSGAQEHVVRTVTENARTLKFRDHGFEAE